ncbi:MAG: hypothetical protein ACHQU0_02370 [Candidatus Paceibacteria bacterium]
MKNGKLIEDLAHVWAGVVGAFIAFMITPIVAALCWFSNITMTPNDWTEAICLWLLLSALGALCTIVGIYFRYHDNGAVTELELQTWNARGQKWFWRTNLVGLLCLLLKRPAKIVSAAFGTVSSIWSMIWEGCFPTDSH